MPAAKRRYTVAEYLEMELVAVEKHEFHDGEILAMSGGTYESSIINANLVSALHRLLQGKPCRVTDSNLRVRPLSLKRYVYPDMVIVCGPPAFDPLDVGRMTINNPSVVIEVLSRSTEAYDRGDKFRFYRELESMHEYVLVSEDRAMLESFLRLPDGTWSFAAFAGVAGIAEIRSLHLRLPLADVYAGIEWPPPASDAEDMSGQMTVLE